MAKQNVNFLLAGVGGQGTILASNILSEVGLRAGYDVKKAEIHGMAQRGGSVNSQVRWGEKVYSPISGLGEVDILVAFEKLEAARYADYLKRGGKLLANRYEITPVSVTSGDAVYPADEQIQSILEQVTADVTFISGVKIAEGLGNAKVQNVVVLGALSTFLNVDEAVWLEAIESLVPPRFLELNKKAFYAGRAAVK